MKNLMRMICVFFLLIYSGVLAIRSDSLDCNFENGLCNWKQYGNGVLNWTRWSGPTPTNGTGPDSDHTSGEGYYVYIDSSEAGKGEISRLISPIKNPGQYCLSLWCYMYGEHVQRLRVLTLKEGTTRLKEVFRITKGQGKSWILIQINVNKTDRFKVIIEGKVKKLSSHDLGDIAIDDILMFSAEECPADCGDPTQEFGLVHSSGNTIIGSTVQTSCEAGYKISGSQSMVCLANGTWSERPVCIPLDAQVKALIAVYIVVPLVVIIFVILLTVYIWKKRKANYAKRNATDTHSIIQYPNKTYNAFVPKQHTRPPEENESMSPDEDYAVVNHGKNRDISENAFHNTECSIRKETEHEYDHIKNTSKPVIDKKYSHVQGYKDDTTFKQDYNTIQLTGTNIEQPRSDTQRESGSYNYIHIRNPNENIKQELLLKIDEEQESNYDHAKAGGLDPVPLEQDEYSHLNDANIIKRGNNLEEMSTPYKNFSISKITEEPKRAEKERKDGYEKPVCHTSHLFGLEKNQNESEDDKYNFQLEAEGNGDENDKSCNHDYFVLEKIECV